MLLGYHERCSSEPGTSYWLLRLRRFLWQRRATINTCRSIKIDMGANQLPQEQNYNPLCSQLFYPDFPPKVLWPPSRATLRQLQVQTEPSNKPTVTRRRWITSKTRSSCNWNPAQWKLLLLSSTLTAPGSNNSLFPSW